MRVVHETEGEDSVLARNVEMADTTLTQMRGLMFRSSLSDEYALVFPFSEPFSWIPDGLSEWRSIHMLGVSVPIDVVWTRREEVTQVRTLRPWRGLAVAQADLIVELPAGAADGVSPGDRVRVVSD